MFKKFCLFCLIIASGYFLTRFCHKQTDGFAVAKIRLATPYNFQTHNSEEDKKLALSILSQPLSYIGRGGQCYAFTTADNKYVVKLLKYNNNYPKIWFRLFPFPFGWESYRQKKLSNKKTKLEGEYRSYQIAVNDLREETGIIYFHIDSEIEPSINLHIQDKLGIFHTLPANQYQFYIQKKGTAFYPKIKQLLDSGKIELAKKSLDDLTLYLIKRCQKKITDGDDGIWRNFAFYGDKPFQIDIGQFSYNSSLCSNEEYQNDLLFFTKDFRRWLEETSPILAKYFTDSILEKTTLD
ncbi:MAG: hypothetical protein JSS09_07170 [Verrucomicrobia bacterium]|nr:hypothetical protein [Verrucomicrobiota bacterium]